MASLDPPEGFVCRYANVSDAAIVAQLFETADIFDIGEPLLTQADIEADWASPKYELSQDVVLVFSPDGELVGYCEVPGWRADGIVLPSYRGCGIGSALADWSEARAVERGLHRVGQTKPDSAPAIAAFFVDRGYTIGHTSWVLSIDPAKVISAKLPADIQIRPCLRSEDEEAFQVVEDAFNEWPGRTPSSFENWSATVLGHAAFEAEMLFVADDGDRLVGVCVATQEEDMLWVDSVAVRRERRSGGIGQSLLASAQAACRDRGLGSLRLSTDSRTGALDLYVNLGMEIEQSFTHHTLDLGAKAKS